MIDQVWMLTVNLEAANRYSTITCLSELCETCIYVCMYTYTCMSALI